MDDEVSRLLARTRARREALNTRLKSVGEEEKEIRSPLKEKNRETLSSSSSSQVSVEMAEDPKGRFLEKKVTKTTEERIETRRVVTFSGKMDEATKEGLKEVLLAGEGVSKTPVRLPEEQNAQPLFEDEKEARKRRLAGLAAKYSAWEDEVPSKTSNLATSEVVDVDSAIHNNSKKKIECNSKKNHSEEAPSSPSSDPSFLKSLKAQGYSESSSKSKLVYDFNRRRSRSLSPVKSYPTVQVSPTRSYIQQVPRRSPSPSKPHPLQFVSPSKAASLLPPPPPKPARTYVQPHMQGDTNPSASSSDTASRQSLKDKKLMFEGCLASPVKTPTKDPALLSLSERKALFEKNKTAPKPIARFGEAVTPAMLSKAQAREAPLSEPAWKRKREEGTPHYTKRRSVSPSERKTSKVDAQKKLFENGEKEGNWRETDLARQTEERKKKDMDLLLKRFVSTQDDQPMERRHEAADEEEEEEEDNQEAEEKMEELDNSIQSTKSEKAATSPHVMEHDNYPGIHSLKKIRVSPPKSGNIYPHYSETEEDTLPRSQTSMSMESTVSSEAPSLGTVIKRAASTKRVASPMPSINEDERNDEDSEGQMETSNCSEEIDDMLDEALDDSELAYSDYGPTPPKISKSSQSTLKLAAKSPTTSTSSWEFEQKTPDKAYKHRSEDFKTPLIEGTGSPGAENLPRVEGVTDGLLHTVSFYRKRQPLPKIVRNETNQSRDLFCEEEDPELLRQSIVQQIKKLQEDAMQQEQRMEQASKALNYCVTKDEFEGSSERVEGERLLLEAFHKYSAAVAEVERLKTEGAMGKTTPQRARPLGCKGSISISGITLRLKTDFIKLINSGIDDFVHYFVCLVKYKSQVIATQMLSSVDGISKGRLYFPNLINVRDLDFDFQIHLEVYALQTRKEVLTHEAKYHIRKDKSVFNLTPLRKLKKQEVSRLPGPRNQNPVNSKTIRRPAFGKVGHTTISLDSIKAKKYSLHDVPPISPLERDLSMNLTAHSENKVEKRGFLTLFTDLNGYGDWNRRWCLLSGNTLRFWKYPEDEMKEVPKYEINLSACITENVTLAPREVCSRMNTFMFETQRPSRSDDRQSLIMHVNRKSGLTRIRHLVMADTREERIAWCCLINSALVNLRAWDPTFRLRSDSESSEVSSSSSSHKYAHASVDSAPSSSSTTEIW